MAEYKLSGKQHTVHNKLFNGNFNRTSYNYSPFPKYAYGIDGDMTHVRWYRERDRTGKMLTTDWNIDILPHWRVRCTEGLNAAIDFNSLDANQNRVWSREGGNVAVFSFDASGDVIIEQDIDYFNEFYLQKATCAFSMYNVSGSVHCKYYIVTDKEEVAVFGTYANIANPRYRGVAVTDCSGDMDKLTIRIVLSGLAGDSVGISGVSFVLGQILPYCPYSQSYVETALPSGAVLLFDGDVALGFQKYDKNVLLYQTYGDPLNIENLFSSSETLDSFSVIDILGSSQHNAHYSYNPYIQAPTSWTTAGAQHAVRIPNIDFADLGNSSRKPSPFVAVKSGGVGGAGWEYRFGSWVDFGIDNDSTLYTTRSVPYYNVMEFAKHTRMAIALPASGGQDFTATTTYTDNGAMDGWEETHRHYITISDKETLPPYRNFRVGIKY